MTFPTRMDLRCGAGRSLGKLNQEEVTLVLGTDHGGEAVLCLLVLPLL